ncbi:MAG TPA: molybdopterin biosynthesis protein [Lacipirellulaceae bacterium]|nr:molybdopterin biosynthesis protein [Lacipirellulaceae bacterium]
MSAQEQFLNVIDRDEAEARFRAALDLKPLGDELVCLSNALGRVLARDVLATVDVPSFDRSNFDGFAVRAAETFGATELSPRHVALLPDAIDAGVDARMELRPGDAVTIATGGMVPRGADAIVMVEHADVVAGLCEAGRPGSQTPATDRRRQLVIRKAVSPGFGISFAGTDIACGETVLRIGTLLTSRETGVLAAIGQSEVAVWRQPRVAIISTGNELIAPGATMRAPHVYDSNAQILTDSVRELGGLPRSWGIMRDDVHALREIVHAALAESDVILLSGGTSKGQGDLCYRVVAELTDPGIVAHGVALKPGKPICLAASGGKPVVILPGFPTSAIFTFHEFVAPVICLLGGRPVDSQEHVSARLAVKLNSEIGRTEYALVNLVQSDNGLVAYPMGKGSGSVTTFSRADGFITIGRHTEIVEAGEPVVVRTIGRGLRIADLVVIGSHCVGLDYLLSELQQRGVVSKLITVGSSAGLEAVRRGECDLAGIHLLDPKTGEYNRPFLTDGMTLINGYGRRQGIVYRRGDERFEGRSIDDIVAQIVAGHSEAGRPETRTPATVMINRNQGSGTRILIDQLLAGARPPGYAVQPTNHNAVAAAVAQGRADWGMAIESVARANDLGFIPYQDERYDFVIPKARAERSAVKTFIALLSYESTIERLARFGFNVAPSGTRHLA